MLPFPGGIEATENATLVFSLGASLFYLYRLDQPPSLLRTVAKSLSILLLAVLAGLTAAPPLLLAALVLSAAGDAFLSRTGDKPFLAGLASFLAAHLVYIALFLKAGAGFGIVMAEPWRMLAAVLMAAISFGALFILLRRVPPTLRLPIAAYSAAILGMGLAALTTGKPMVIAGAVLFMASDTVLAWERFVVAGLSPAHRPMRFAVWVLYYAAQLAITLGFLLGR